MHEDVDKHEMNVLVLVTLGAPQTGNWNLNLYTCETSKWENLLQFKSYGIELEYRY